MITRVRIHWPYKWCFKWSTDQSLIWKCASWMNTQNRYRKKLSVIISYKKPWPLFSGNCLYIYSNVIIMHVLINGIWKHKISDVSKYVISLVTLTLFSGQDVHFYCYNFVKSEQLCNYVLLPMRNSAVLMTRWWDDYVFEEAIMFWLDATASLCLTKAHLFGN